MIIESQCCDVKNVWKIGVEFKKKKKELFGQLFIPIESSVGQASFYTTVDYLQNW